MKVRSKQQQKLLHALADKGVLSQAEASERSRRGKAYKAMPKKKRTKAK